MKKLSLFLYSHSKLWHALVLTGLMIAYASVIMNSKSDCFLKELNDDQNLLGLKFGYTYDEAACFFDSLSEDGLKCYKNLLSKWDSIFPLIYASMYMAWLSLIYRKLGKGRRELRLINLYPLIPMFADWAENISELFLISEYTSIHKISESSIRVSSLITQIKWSLSTLNYIIILTGIVFLIKNKLSIKNKTL